MLIHGKQCLRRLSQRKLTLFRSLVIARIWFFTEVCFPLGAGFPAACLTPWGLAPGFPRELPPAPLVPSRLRWNMIADTDARELASCPPGTSHVSAECLMAQEKIHPGCLRSSWLR